VRPNDIEDYFNAGLQYVVAKPVKQHLFLVAIERTLDPQKSKQYIVVPKINAVNDPQLLDQSMIDTHLHILGPEKVAKLMQFFCNTQQQLWPALQLSLANNNYYELEQQAHQLAGACDMLGFAQASKLLRQLEKNAKEGNIEPISAMLEPLQLIIAQSADKASTWR
jgi:HPt (histidine-containing phosphotransfer) domain-containing protein